MVETKTILNQNNEKIFVELHTPAHIKGTVVFCHGITGCRKGRTMEDNYFQLLADKLMQLNYKAVLFDFSGHGESEGNDYEVTLSKSTDELSRVFYEEVDQSKDIKFLAFSYGATVLGNFLSENPSVHPSKVVLYSPCFYPLESCFLNENSIFGKDILSAYNNGTLKQTGYAIVGAKNFKFGYQMIEDCKIFSPSQFEKISDKVLVLSGTQDVILEVKYNDKFCKENNIKMLYFNASHSLFEDICNVFTTTLEYFEI